MTDDDRVGWFFSFGFPRCKTTLKEGKKLDSSRPYDTHARKRRYELSLPSIYSSLIPQYLYSISMNMNTIILVPTYLEKLTETVVHMWCRPIPSISHHRPHPYHTCPSSFFCSIQARRASILGFFFLLGFS